MAAKTFQKRALQHPPIPAPSTRGAPKIVYVSAKSPFVAAVKRVEAALKALAAPAPGKQPKKLAAPDEGVTLKATGKAIDRALQLGTHFMALGDRVRIVTGSMAVVDDVVDLPEGVVREEKRKRKRAPADVEMKDGDAEAEEVEMVARMVSVIEVQIVRKKEVNK